MVSSKIHKIRYNQARVSEEFDQAGIVLRIVTMPDGAKTPEAQLLSNVRGIIAEYERAKILERTARGRRGRAQAGHVPYGRRTFGYRYVKHGEKGAHYEVDPEEAALVQRIFRLCVTEGLSVYAIAERLTTEDIPTPKDRMRTLPARVRPPRPNSPATNFRASATASTTISLSTDGCAVASVEAP